MYGMDGDDDNSLEVQAQTTLSFVVNKPADFESTQVKNNALKINLTTKKSNCSVFARVSSYTTPLGADKGNIPLELQFRSDNSSNATSIVTTPIQLTASDKRLFVQPKSSKNFTFQYDLRLMPLGYNYPEGQYNFTILYTMTQP